MQIESPLEHRDILPNNCEAETDSAMTPDAGFRQLRERLRDLIEQRGTESRAGVAHLNFDCRAACAPSGLPDFDRNGPHVRKFDGVEREIDDR